MHESYEENLGASRPLEQPNAACEAPVAAGRPVAPLGSNDQAPPSLTTPITARPVALQYAPATAATPPAPASSAERFAVLDVIRGFAVFGILIANIQWFNFPSESDYLLRPPWQSGSDAVTNWLLTIFVRGKFYTLFALLFGAGFALQMTRLRSRGARFWTLYLRRVLVLAGFGFVHVVAIWYGDILHAYAAMGLLLLLFAWMRPRWLIVAGLIAFCVPHGITAWRTHQFQQRVAADPELAKELEYDRALYAEYIAGEITIVPEREKFTQEYNAMEETAYTSASYADALSMRFTMLPGRFSRFPWPWFRTLGLFLLGAAAVRAGVIAEPQRHRTLLFALATRALPAGLVAAGAYAWFRATSVEFFMFDWPRLAAWVLRDVQALLMAAGIAAIFLLTLSGPLPRALNPLAAVGRTALTNYIAQSVICTTLFYGYGFGLYGHISLTGGVLIALMIFAVQVAISAVWLHYFRFGPLEWLWRSLTYLCPQPLRQKAQEQQTTLS